MNLAKDCLDVGVYTERYDELRRFWEGEVGLPYEELLKAGRGVHQHRLGLPHGSVFKLNASRDPLPTSPSRFGRLHIATDRVTTPIELTDPDGTTVELVPPGHDGVTGIGVEWRSTDPDRLRTMLVDGFGATQDDAGHRLRIGTTLLLLTEGATDGDDGGGGGQLRATPGIRYLTVQVTDVRHEHAHLRTVGWTEQTPPIKLGDTAYISFVRDPDGALVEVSQRASLTGPLPDA
ncbi:MAG TPA: VOC family protein [Acidimicrobiales bacterium]|nr:VOC family protein [Acidimicrobiales bacterium]